MKLAAVNTIGLTGAEIIAAELARMPEILMLPGQNFIQFAGCCYRPHQYDGWSADAIFDSLSQHQFTRSGRCWAGLTKSLPPGAAYSKERHKDRFRRKVVVDDARNVIDCFRWYAESYAESMGEAIEQKRYFGFFGHNIIVNAPHYPDFAANALVIDVTNPIDYWLANIGQKMVWNSLGAIKFWLVNSLLSRLIAREGAIPFHSVDVRNYTADPESVRTGLRRFLGATLATSPAPPGFIEYEPAQVAAIERNAATLRTLYAEEADFRAAMHFAQWCDDFLADPVHRDRLRDYQAFWNSTVHTNLDWVGPIEDEIIERIRQHTGYRSGRNISRWFFHDCFALDSDDWESPVPKLQHYLGTVEDQILLPEMPYYARIVLCYLESVAVNFIKRPDSRFPLRESSLYRRVTAPAYSRHFSGWALTAKRVEVEARIDAAVAGLGAPAVQVP